MKSYMNHLLRPPLPTILSLLIIASAVIYTGNFGLNNQLAAVGALPYANTVYDPSNDIKEANKSAAALLVTEQSDKKALDDLTTKLATAKLSTNDTLLPQIDARNILDSFLTLSKTPKYVPPSNYAGTVALSSAYTVVVGDTVPLTWTGTLPASTKIDIFFTDGTKTIPITTIAMSAKKYSWVVDPKLFPQSIVGNIGVKLNAAPNTLLAQLPSGIFTKPYATLLSDYNTKYKNSTQTVAQLTTTYNTTNKAYATLKTQVDTAQAKYNNDVANYASVQAQIATLSAESGKKVTPVTVTTPAPVVATSSKTATLTAPVSTSAPVTPAPVAKTPTPTTPAPVTTPTPVVNIPGNTLDIAAYNDYLAEGYVDCTSEWVAYTAKNHLPPPVGPQLALRECVLPDTFPTKDVKPVSTLCNDPDGKQISNYHDKNANGYADEVGGDGKDPNTSVVCGKWTSCMICDANNADFPTFCSSQKQDKLFGAAGYDKWIDVAPGAPSSFSQCPKSTRSFFKITAQHACRTDFGRATAATENAIDTLNSWNIDWSTTKNALIGITDYGCHSLGGTYKTDGIADSSFKEALKYANKFQGTIIQTGEQTYSAVLRDKITNFSTVLSDGLVTFTGVPTKSSDYSHAFAVCPYVGTDCWTSGSGVSTYPEEIKCGDTNAPDIYYCKPNATGPFAALSSESPGTWQNECVDIKKQYNSLVSITASLGGSSPTYVQSALTCNFMSAQIPSLKAKAQAISEGYSR